ncbi:MAG: hypothetical protein IID40_10470 [Planctomycetes bacterium]|nr:hypothetical protein [Planctomycetota bacterium]
MGLEHTRLVRRIQMRLNDSDSVEPAGALGASAVADLHDRVERLQRLGGRYSAVRVSGHVVGLRAVSVPDRAEGVPSPGMV